MAAHTLRAWMVLGLLGTTALGACGGEEDDAAEAAVEAPPVVLGPEDVAVATLEELGARVVITGSLQPAYRANVKAQVGGTVSGITVDRGSTVREGQPLATIEAEGVRAQAAAADANLALARQRLESARTLRDAGALSAIDFSAAEAAYEAAVAQAEGARELAQRATVRAPIAGVVSERRVEQGEAVSSGDEMFTVVRSDVLELAGAVPVDAAAQIRPGQAVVFVLSAFPGREFRGEVARIEPIADPETRRVGVYLRMRNPGGVIGGQFATGQVLGGTTVETVVVPESAIRGGGADTHVFVVEGGRVAKRPVVLGVLDVAEGRAGIASGLEAGAQVIIAPTTAVPEGARVQLGAPAAPKAAHEEGA